MPGLVPCRNADEQIFRININQKSGRPKDAALSDSGAEVNVENDIAAFVRRLQPTSTKIGYADASQQLRVKGHGLVRKWYKTRDGSVYVDEYWTYYCPDADYPVRSEVNMEAAGWSFYCNPYKKTIVQTSRGNVVFEARNVTFLLDPQGHVLVTRKFDNRTLDWLVPIQLQEGDANIERQLRGSKNSQELINKYRDRDSEAEVLASLAEIDPVTEADRLASALSSAHLVHSVRFDADLSSNTRQGSPTEPTTADDAVIPRVHSYLDMLTAKSHVRQLSTLLDKTVSSYLRARAQKYGEQGETVTLAQMTLQGAIDDIKEFDANHACGQNRERLGIYSEFDSRVATINVFTRCEGQHPQSLCRYACWHCGEKVGHRLEPPCPIAADTRECVAKPADDILRSRRLERQAEIESQNFVNSLYLQSNVSGNPYRLNFNKPASKTGASPHGTTSFRPANGWVPAKEVVQAMNILCVDQESDAKNEHLSTSEGAQHSLLLNNFKASYHPAGYLDIQLSVEVPTTNSSGGGAVTVNTISLTDMPARKTMCMACLSDSTEDLRRDCLFTCDNPRCKGVFEQLELGPRGQASVVSPTHTQGPSTLKRDQPDVLYTPEKLVDMRRILLRNLMTPVSTVALYHRLITWNVVNGFCG